MVAQGSPKETKTKREPQGSQKGSKRPPKCIAKWMSGCYPRKVTEKSPKRCPNDLQKLANGIPREPKGSQRGTQRRLKCTPKSTSEGYKKKTAKKWFT